MGSIKSHSILQYTGFIFNSDYINLHEAIIQNDLQ